MIKTNGKVTFNFHNKQISRRVSNTHARPGHQPIYVQKDRTDTDIYICSQKYYKENNLIDITGVECPNNERIAIHNFKLRKDVFNSYITNLKSAFKNHGLNEFYKDTIDDIFTIMDDLSTSLVILHTTQQKVRIGFGSEPLKKIILDSLVGDLTQITFDFNLKEIYLTIPEENLDYLRKEVGKDPYEIKPGTPFIVKEDSVDNDKLLEEAKTLQIDQNALLEKYGENGNVIHDMLKARSSSLQNYFRELLIEKHKNCLLCDISDKELLIASHIKPAAISNTIEKADIKNGLLLCPLHDKLFDRGYISFDSKSGQLIASKLVLENKSLYRLETKKTYPEVKTKQVKHYMQYHNEHIFKGKM